MNNGVALPAAEYWLGLGIFFDESFGRVYPILDLILHIQPSYLVRPIVGSTIAMIAQVIVSGSFDTFSETIWSQF